MTYTVELFRTKDTRPKRKGRTLNGARAIAYMQLQGKYYSKETERTYGIFDDDSGAIVGTVSYFSISKKENLVICWTAITKRGYRVSRLNKDGSLGELIAEYV